MNIFSSIVMLLLISSPLYGLLGQTYVNVDWSFSTGLPDPQIPWTSSKAYGGEFLYVVGNTQVIDQGLDVLLTKYDIEGQVVWQQTYNHIDSVDDYGVDLIVDAWGNIVVCAASLSDLNGTSDYLILKYSSNGSLEWEYTYDGIGEGEDYPSSLTFDAQGNIYITGTSQGIGTDFDYTTLKLDTNGKHIWTKRYDRSGLSDVAVKIMYWAEGDRLMVTGGSGETTSDWDYVTLSYKTNGTLDEEGITDNPGIGFDKPADMALASDGSMYITGAAAQNGNDYEIYTIKLDTSFQLVWERSYGSLSGQEGGLTIAVDGNHEVWVGGFTGTASNTRGQLLKYSASGALLSSPIIIHGNNRSSQVKDLFVLQDGGTLVCTEVSSSGSTEIRLTEYSSKGLLKWQQNYTHVSPASDHPLSLVVNPLGNIFITGLSRDLGGDRYLTLAYQILDLPSNIQVFPGTSQLYEPDQIIIRVEPEWVDTSRVNQILKPFGTIQDFLSPNLISEMDSVLDTFGTLENWTLIKLFRNLTTYTDHSISRLGEKVPMPDFWTTFILRLPNASDGPTYDVSEVASALDSLSGIRYTELCYLDEITSFPNDSLYTLQHSLQSTTYPDGHLFIEDAWSHEVGRPEIKVAVFDEGIDWRHPDFGFDGVDTATSVVKGGTDFYNNSISIFQSGIFASALSGNHGTSAAGIIGAQRNNQLGVAGIAGGDNLQNGISLYSMRVCSGKICNRSLYRDAYLEAVTLDTINNFGLGVHITNHSYGSVRAASPTYREIVDFAFRNQVVQVAARGNNNNTANFVPSTIRDEYILSVGASKTDGEKSPFSSYGREMDVIAPGVLAMIQTTDTTVNGQAQYISFNGTSAAAPHVAGVAALMLSRINPLIGYDDLSPEDVEHMLQWTATDKNVVGYDDLTGYGLVHAGRVLDRLDTAKYRIQHYTSTVVLDTLSTPVSTGIIKFIPDDYGLPSSATNYIVDVYKYQHIYTYTQAPSIRVDTAWVRNSSSTLLGSQDNTTSLANLPAITLESFSQNSAIASGYYLFVRSTASGDPVNRFIPADTARLAISLYLNDTTTFTTNTPSPLEDSKLVVFPNPTAGNINFQVTGSLLIVL